MTETDEKYWKRLWKNVMMSTLAGAAGLRTNSNPKKSGRLRKGNQSTSRHDISITIDDLKELWERQGGKCHWLGGDMILEELFVSHSPFAPSVDRLDNSKGYHPDNIVLCSRFANKGRGAYNHHEFATKLSFLLQRKNNDERTN